MTPLSWVRAACLAEWVNRKPVATFGCRHCGSHRVLRHGSPEFDAFEAECSSCPGMVAHHARIELLPVEAK